MNHFNYQSKQYQRATTIGTQSLVLKDKTYSKNRPQFTLNLQTNNSLIKEKTLPSLSILITANRSNEIREEANEIGLQYLPKPAKPLALKRMIKSFL